MSVKGPELLNKYVGESEKAVRMVFNRARASAPCLIFFDEIDALCPKRDEAQSEATQRVVNTLLTELDGVDGRQGVFVLGATNRPDIIDPALLRPGRIDKLKYVPLPDGAGRQKILARITESLPIDQVDMSFIAAETQGYSGADIAALVREACAMAIRDVAAHVHMSHFKSALLKSRASVSDKDHKVYLELQKQFE